MSQILNIKLMPCVYAWTLSVRAYKVFYAGGPSIEFAPDKALLRQLVGLPTVQLLYHCLHQQGSIGLPLSCSLLAAITDKGSCHIASVCVHCQCRACCCCGSVMQDSATLEDPHAFVKHTD